MAEYQSYHISQSVERGGAKHYTMSKYNADSIKTDEPNKMGLLKQGSGRFWT